MHIHILRATLLVLSLLTVAGAAEPLPKEGYEIITPPQPTENADKIEVIEFFWYGCPHCYRFIPYVSAWLKKIPEDVQYIRQPAAFNERWAQHAKAYFTAEALGVVDKVHDDFFDAIQNKHEKLTSEKELAEFFAKHGVAEKDFRDAYNSFYVATKMKQATALPARYGVTGTPTIIVNGKYRIKAPLEKVFEIADRLIEKERAEKSRN